MLKKGTWFLLFITLAVSCLDDPDCYSLNNNMIQISFKKLSDRKADVIAFKDIKAENATTAVLEYTGKSVSIVNLPLDYLKTTTTYTFRYSDVQIPADTLTLQYLSKPQFVSDSCGQRFVLSDLSILATTFDTDSKTDSIAVVSTNPFKASTAASKPTIEIYRP